MRERHTTVEVAARLLVATLAAASGCTKVPQDPNDPKAPVWNPEDHRAPPTVFEGPTVYLSPGVKNVLPRQPFTLDVKTVNFDEHAPQQVKGMHLVLEFPAGMTYIGVDTLDFLRGGGNTVLGLVVAGGDSLVLDFLRAGSPSGASTDSGGVARLRLSCTQSTELAFRSDKCLLRDGDNKPITYFSTRSALVEVR